MDIHRTGSEKSPGWYLQVRGAADTRRKKKCFLKNQIAVWDVIASCDIAGSSDSSIKNVVPVDLSVILSQADIAHIYANGATAKKLYEKYQQDKTGIPIIGSPSTSPANASYSLERLTDVWVTNYGKHIKVNELKKK